MYYQQYVEVSECAKQLKMYLDCFSTENILLIDYEDFKKNVSMVVNSAYLFLGVNEVLEPNVMKKHNTFTMPKNAIIWFIYSFVDIRKFLIYLIPKKVVSQIKLLLFKNDKNDIGKRERAFQCCMLARFSLFF